MSATDSTLERVHDDGVCGHGGRRMVVGWSEWPRSPQLPLFLQIWANGVDTLVVGNMINSLYISSVCCTFMVGFSVLTIYFLS